MNKHLEATIIIASLALVFGCTSLFDELSIQRFAMGGLFGAYLGFAGLPLLDSKKWSPQYFLCGLLGGLAAMALASHRTASFQQIVLAGIFGAVVGLLAPIWAKYM